jgi:serine/threonine protein kinase
MFGSGGKAVFSSGSLSDEATSGRGRTSRKDRTTFLNMLKAMEEQEAALDGSSTANQSMWTPSTDYLRPAMPTLKMSSNDDKTGFLRYPRNISIHDLTFIRLLGHGASSDVYACTFRGNEVVMKVPRKDLDKQGQAGSLKSLLAERSVLEAMKVHPNIIHYYGSGHLQREDGSEDEDRPFLLVERLTACLDVEAGTDKPCSISPLRHKIARRRMPMSRAISLMHQAAEALSFLHQGGGRSGCILHRDFKPSNMGIDSMGRLKLFDFGLSRWMKTDDVDQLGLFRLTGDTGSLRYMAPEVAKRQPYSESVDVYSWAIVTAEILQLRRAYLGFTLKQLFSQVIYSGERPKLSSKIPPELAELIHECWQDDFQLRPTMKDVCQRMACIVKALSPC